VAAYRECISGNGLETMIGRLIGEASADDIQSMNAQASDIGDLFTEATAQDGILAEITNAYQRLAQDCGSSDLRVAVRSSSTAEDMQQESFAGQYDSYLNVRGESELIDAVKRR
jgi:pyruvate,water dikinase|tara:strand:+ start:3240 stop:3581 length:342 start_codon:yes stop_codon:yes gene_type:complete